jgi:hypothetical protein
MSDFTIRFSIAHTVSSLVEGCVSFVRQRQTLVGGIALAALSALGYVLYRHLTTKRDDSMAGRIASTTSTSPTFTSSDSNGVKQNKIDKQTLTHNSEEAEKEKLELQKLKQRIQEAVSARQSDNHAILLSLPSHRLHQIQLYQRLDQLVLAGEIQAWMGTIQDSLIIRFKEDDIDPSQENSYDPPWLWCVPTYLANNRWGWRDQKLVSLEEVFRKANPLKEIDLAALTSLTLDENSIKNVLVELKARGKAGACYTYLGPYRESALFFLKFEGIIYDFEKTHFNGRPHKVFVTAEDKEIEEKIQALSFPPNFSSTSFDLHRDISNAYRQRWTEGKTSFIVSSGIYKDLDALVGAGTISSWRGLRNDGVLVRFSEDDPVEQTEEDFDHTKYLHMKAGWRTQALLAQEEELRQKNRLNIREDYIKKEFYDKREISESDKKDCQRILGKLNARVQIGPYTIGEDNSWRTRSYERDFGENSFWVMRSYERNLIEFLNWPGQLGENNSWGLRSYEIEFIQFLSSEDQFKKIEWLEDGEKKTCKVWVKEHDLDPQPASS